MGCPSVDPVAVQQGKAEQSVSDSGIIIIHTEGRLN